MNPKTERRPQSITPADRNTSAVATSQTLDQRVAMIKALGERINAYVQFMCKSQQLQGVSMEVHESAVIAFHERLVVVEKQLARIHEAFQLE